MPEYYMPMPDPRDKENNDNKGPIFLFIILVVTFIIFTLSSCSSKPKFDYYMQLHDNNIYLIDKKGDTIYKEQMNWNTPNQLQLALIKDNL